MTDLRPMSEAPRNGSVLMLVSADFRHVQDARFGEVAKGPEEFRTGWFEGTYAGLIAYVSEENEFFAGWFEVPSDVAEKLDRSQLSEHDRDFIKGELVGDD